MTNRVLAQSLLISTMLVAAPAAQATRSFSGTWAAEDPNGDIRFTGTMTLAQGSAASFRETWQLDAEGRILTVSRIVEAAAGTTMTNSRRIVRSR